MRNTQPKGRRTMTEQTSTTATRTMNERLRADRRRKDEANAAMARRLFGARADDTTDPHDDTDGAA